MIETEETTGISTVVAVIAIIGVVLLVGIVIALAVAQLRHQRHKRAWQASVTTLDPIAVAVHGAEAKGSGDAPAGVRTTPSNAGPDKDDKYNEPPSLATLGLDTSRLQGSMSRLQAALESSEVGRATPPRPAPTVAATPSVAPPSSGLAARWHETAQWLERDLPPVLDERASSSGGSGGSEPPLSAPTGPQRPPRSPRSSGGTEGEVSRWISRASGPVSTRARVGGSDVGSDPGSSVAVSRTTSWDRMSVRRDPSKQNAKDTPTWASYV